MNSTLPQKLLLFLLATQRLHISEPLTLPQELIVEILLRLPVKSLLRFKCVCKSWFSLISDPHFAKLHFDSAARPTYVLLMSHNGSSIQSMDAEASLHDDSALSNLVLPHPPNARVINFRLLGCCHGFIAFDYDDERGDVMLWNPSNGVHMHIPYRHRFYDYKDKIVYGFGHASKDNDYLILAKMHDYHYYSDSYVAYETNKIESKYFSLKTVSWNNLAQGIDFPEVNSGFGSFLNGALHWLTLDGTIVAFDLVEKSLSEIPKPDDLSLNMSVEDNSRMTVMEECLCLSCLDAEREVVEIWIMREYKVQSSWTKAIDLSTHDIPVGNFFLPMCFTKSGGIIGSTEFGGLAKFNANGELLEHRIFDHRKGIHHGVYKESLLSLPNMTDMRKQKTVKKEEKAFIYIN